MLELELQYEDYTLVWEYIGEGYFGEYDANLNDERLYRFTLYKNDEQVSDVSYCTLVTEEATKRQLTAGLVVMMKAFIVTSSKKKAGEVLSRIRNATLERWAKREMDCPLCGAYSVLDGGNDLHWRICNGCHYHWNTLNELSTSTRDPNPF